MLARRTMVLVAAAAAAFLPAPPALAHGAPTQPISRTDACAAGGEKTGAPACKAARAANGRAFGRFDNLRVPDVDGRDKELIPDGRLCSGGLADFKGLDLPRADLPATKVTAGGTLAIRYVGTIPHEGTFRIYLTRQGYDPAQPLGWDDLAAKPILTVTDPPLTGGSYRMRAKLPKDRTGRHVLYTVWQTSSTPDTYYSCSDLQIKAPAAALVRPRQATATPKPSRSAHPGVVAAPPEPDAPAQDGTQARQSWLSPASAQAEDRVALGHQIILATLTVLVGLAVGAVVKRLRRSRSRNR
jgi:predicted carbohydrate-binding protein with CBM5 and CBM33 domain